MTEWQRIDNDNTPIYIRPNMPDWFVPNPVADDALMRLSEKKAVSGLGLILARLTGEAAPPYDTRTECLSLDDLTECWIHVTDQCNLACRHCMFTSGPHGSEELSTEDCARIIHDTYALGCRLYYFTGGEPLASKVFFQSIREILDLNDTHVTVLTNLSLVSRHIDQLHPLPKDRLHFQVSMDGLQTNHDALRGAGAFKRLGKDLNILMELGFPITLATTVTRRNVDEMAKIIDFAGQQQISNVHFLWLFQKGKADADLFVEPENIFHALTEAHAHSEKTGVRIDNIDMIRSQVFSCPGTRYDLSNAAWQSIAVGPEGYVYPTPALVYSEEMRCGHIRDGIETVWRQSPLLREIRSVSLNQSEAYGANPFRYLIGGGDIDHSYVHTGKLVGGDPYVDLYNRITKWLIAKEAQDYQTDGYPAFLLKMGEKLGDCPMAGGNLFFTHSNCVLSLPGHDTHGQVNRFYTDAAQKIKEDILNPICYEEGFVSHIPEQMRYRSYGCGSPVLEAEIRPGETVVDLGSGTGIECFIAGKLTGDQGRVVGIDMGDVMLSMANDAKAGVVENLGYDVIEFKQAFLEDLPLRDDSVDLVISNCVLNLSPDKRRVFSEISRILKPGGRLVISDITYDADLSLDIKYNETLRGECIGGALRYQDLFGLLNDLGFSRSTILKGYHYRRVEAFDFYSITYEAFKPENGHPAELYDFPDFNGVMAAVKSEPTCACFLPPQEPKPANSPFMQTQPHQAGCMACGATLVYLDTDEIKTCHYCEQTTHANAICEKEHFICDACHQGDAVDIIRQVCLHTQETDAFSLMQTIRSHPRFGLHGPEHHALVPAVILTVLKNAGHNITDDQILAGIQRGQTVAGGACAFMGACGAAVGAGIAFSILIGANPIDGQKRQAAQKATQQVLARIAAYNAPRCCQRDSWLAMKEIDNLLAEKFGYRLSMESTIVCEQFHQNKECIHDLCPLWPCRR